MRRGNSSRWKLHLQSCDWRPTFCSIPISANRNKLTLHIKPVSGKTTIQWRLVSFTEKKCLALCYRKWTYTGHSNPAAADSPGVNRDFLSPEPVCFKQLHKTLQLPLQNLSKHLQLVLLGLHLTTRLYHCKCFRRIFFKGLKIHKKPQTSSLSYNFKLSKVPVRCCARPTPASSFVWCPARTLLPWFSVSPKTADIPHPGVTQGSLLPLWSSCGAHEHSCEHRTGYPTHSLSHRNIFYGRVSTRIMKTMFKSKRRQIFDEYQGTTAGREGVGKKVWIEGLSCPVLPGAAGSVTEVADGCPLPAVGKGMAPLTAAGLQTLNGWLIAAAGATLHSFIDSKLLWCV